MFSTREFELSKRGVTDSEFCKCMGVVARAADFARSDAKGFSSSTISRLSFKKKTENFLCRRVKYRYELVLDRTCRSGFVERY